MIKKVLSIALIITILIMTSGTIFVAQAASLTALSDTMSNQTISANSSHIIKFTTPTGVTASGQTIAVTFPSGFNFTSKAISSLTLTYGATGTNTTATIAASAGAGVWGAAFTGTNKVILTLTAPTSGTYIAATNEVILTYDSTNSINPGTAANYTISIAANTDSGTIIVPILTSDQVAVTASVSQSLTFALSQTAIDFGALSISAPEYATGGAASGGTATEAAAHTLAITTSAASGYSITLSGDTLKSGSNTITALGATPTALAAGTSQFGIRATSSGGTGATIATPYGGAAGSYGFGTSPPLNQASFASSTSATATTTYSVFYGADISATTGAGNYSTTLTYVATANY